MGRKTKCTKEHKKWCVQLCHPLRLLVFCRSSAPSEDGLDMDSASFLATENQHNCPPPAADCAITLFPCAPPQMRGNGFFEHWGWQCGCVGDHAVRGHGGVAGWQQCSVPSVQVADLASAQHRNRTWPNYHRLAPPTARTSLLVGALSPSRSQRTQNPFISMGTHP